MESANTVYILGHQGWTDFFSQYAVYKHWFSRYPNHKHTVLVYNPSQLTFVKRLFNSIQVEQIKTTETYQPEKTCLECHMTGSPYSCPRTAKRCIYPDYPQYQNLIGLCAFDNYLAWETVQSNCQAKGKPFIEAFYEYYTLPFSTLYEQFDVERIPELEYTYDVGNPYIAYHEQPHVQIQKDVFFDSNTLYLELDQSSDDFFKSIGLIIKAKEIHLVQSSYCMLCYILQLRYGLLKDIPIFVHEYSRKYSEAYKNMFKNPSLPNWSFY
jgi:hypothetical protein